MISRAFTPAFLTSPAESGPIPDEYAEPLERLLTALTAGGTLLILRQEESVEPGWLTPERIEAQARQGLAEPALIAVWPLMTHVWAISLLVPDAAELPMTPVPVHALCRSFQQRLTAEWQAYRVDLAPVLRLETTSGQPTREAVPAALEADQSASEEAELQPQDTDQSPGDALQFRTRQEKSQEKPDTACFHLLPVTPVIAGSDISDHIAELNALLEIIVNRQLHTQFQPIVSLRDGQVYAYEALIRGPKGRALRRAGAMFQAADRARMVAWYDIACQEQCFALAAAHGMGKNARKRLLFINMEAEGLAYMDVYNRSLANCAREYGLSPAEIVIEITERQTVGDFPRLLEFIEKLREEGFKIAIDDAGTGYNSLHAIAELRPDFVKIDRSLVRNIDINGTRRALLQTLVQYARQIGTQVLAEGAETREELQTLITLGVSLGQGYVMGRPADDFRGVPREMREFIQECARQQTLLSTGRRLTIQSLAREGLLLPADTPLPEAVRRFSKEENLTSIAIEEGGSVIGLITREQVQHILDITRTAKALDMLPEESLGQWMQTSVLYVDKEECVEEVARQSLLRDDISLQTDVVVVEEGTRYVGVVPVRNLLETASTIRQQREQYAHPLTGLPGIVTLEQLLRERLTARGPLAVLRTNIERLEPFNRRYGIAHGDAVIQALARLLTEASTAHGGPNDVLTHLGGDDFVLLTRPDAAEPICRALMAGFPAIVRQFHSAEHVRQGYVEVEEGGQIRRLPLFRLLAAAETNRTHRLPAEGILLDNLNALMRTLRKQPGSRYVIE